MAILRCMLGNKDISTLAIKLLLAGILVQEVVIQVLEDRFQKVNCSKMIPALGLI